MKVILTEEVTGLGEPGKLVDVAPGYARNFLVPRKLAVYANKASTRELEHHRQRLERKRQRLITAARSVTERLDGLTVVIEAKIGQGGKLFGAVTTHDIAEAIKTQLGVDVDRRKLHLREAIHTTGTHPVEIRLMGDSHAIVQVQVGTPEPVAPVVPTPAPAPVEDASEEAAE